MSWVKYKLKPWDTTTHAREWQPLKWLTITKVYEALRSNGSMVQSVWKTIAPKVNTYLSYDSTVLFFGGEKNKYMSLQILGHKCS